MSEPVTLINAFEVPAADAADFIAGWERTRDYLEQQPGYIDTALQQAFAPDAEFQFVNVAHWRSAEDFAKALGSPGFREAAVGLAQYPSHPSLYRTVRT
jgi:heme oxygenase (mycobilin-producing)